MRRCFPAAYPGEGLWPCAPTAVDFTANIRAELAASIPNTILIMCDDVGDSELGCYAVLFLPPTLDALTDPCADFIKNSAPHPPRSSAGTNALAPFAWAIRSAVLAARWRQREAEEMSFS
jgi:hypothetical protein